MNLFNTYRDTLNDAGHKSRSWTRSSLWPPESEELLRESSFFAVSSGSAAVDPYYWEAIDKVEHQFAAPYLFDWDRTIGNIAEAMLGRRSNRSYVRAQVPIILHSSNTSSTAVHVTALDSHKSINAAYTVLDLSREYQAVSRPFTPTEAKSYREFIDDFFD